jgi:hypothetical protein
MHLYLTRDATCVHCGMRFGLAWSAERGWLTAPLRRNLVLSIGGFLLAGAGFTVAVQLLSLGALFVGIYFMIRSVLGTVETFMKHGFVPGRLGTLIPRTKFNPANSKPAYVLVGRVKFPFDETVYSNFERGETLLVEHLKWSRLPVAIYRGHLPN